MRKVLLYHFAPCAVSFCPVHGAKWYSWPDILNAWFEALMSLYACFSFAQVVANTWQCIIYLKAIRYIQSQKQEKNISKKVDHFASVSPSISKVMPNGDPEGRIFLSHPHNTNNGLFFLLTIKNIAFSCLKGSQFLNTLRCDIIWWRHFNITMTSLDDCIVWVPI